MRTTKVFSVFAIGFLLAFSSLIQLQGQSKKDTPLNLITYNIRMSTPDDGVNAWPLRKEKVASLLKFHQADIFNVQEALPEQMDDLVALFPGFEHVGVGRDDGIRKGEHMAVFYNKTRFDKITDGMFWLSQTPINQVLDGMQYATELLRGSN